MTEGIINSYITYSTIGASLRSHNHLRHSQLVLLTYLVKKSPEHEGPQFDRMNRIS